MCNIYFPIQGIIHGAHDNMKGPLVVLFYSLLELGHKSIVVEEN